MRARIASTSLVLIGLAMGSFAAEPAAEVRLADGKDLIAHWNQGPIAQTWKDPVFNPFRTKFDEQSAEAAKDLGFDPWKVLPTLTRIRMVANASADPAKPVDVVASLDAGTFAQALFGKLAQDKPAAQIPGADQAVTVDQVTVARFVSALVATFGAPPKAPGKEALPTPGSDIEGTANLDLCAAIAQKWAKTDAGKQDLGGQKISDVIDNATRTWKNHDVHRVTYQARFVPEGVLERFVSDGRTPKELLAVDRVLLARLPANTLVAAGMGWDGAQAWKERRSELLAGLAGVLGTSPTDPDATEKALDASFAKIQMPVTAKDLITGWKGTTLVGLTPGMPAPGVILAIPRSPAMDTLVGWALAKVPGQPTLPAEGASAIIPIPNVPVVLTLARDAGHWLLTTDPMFASAFLTGKANGWADTAPAKLVLGKAPATAYIVGASDTPAVLRTLGGYAGMALAFAKDLDPDSRNAIMQAFPLLAAKAQPGYIFAGTKAGDKLPQQMEMRSLTGMATLPVIAGLALPAFNMARHAGGGAAPGANNESAAATTLMSGIFPAQIQFQAGCYQDADGDTIGEYGTLGQLSGREVPSGGKKLQLVTGALAKGDIAQGYRFQVFLPESADAQEKHFVVYAWPLSSGQGRPLALLENGIVYASPTAVEANGPAWNAVFDGKEWGSAPAWPVYIKDAPFKSKKTKAKTTVKSEPTESKEPKPAQGNQF